jgi:hypothetical protein
MTKEHADVEVETGFIWPGERTSDGLFEHDNEYMDSIKSWEYFPNGFMALQLEFVVASVYHFWPSFVTIGFLNIVHLLVC